LLLYLSILSEVWLPNFLRVFNTMKSLVFKTSFSPPTQKWS
jgi:hypothetical protein